MKVFIRFFLLVFFLYIFANLTFLRSYIYTPRPHNLAKKKKTYENRKNEHLRKMKSRALIMNVLPTIFLIYGTCLYCLHIADVSIPEFWLRTYIELLLLSYAPFAVYWIFIRSGSVSPQYLYEVSKSDDKVYMYKFAAWILWIINIIILLFALYIVSDNLAEFPLR